MTLEGIPWLPCASVPAHLNMHTHMHGKNWKHTFILSELIYYQVYSCSHVNSWLDWQIRGFSFHKSRSNYNCFLYHLIKFNLFSLPLTYTCFCCQNLTFFFRTGISYWTSTVSLSYNPNHILRVFQHLLFLRKWLKIVLNHEAQNLLLCAFLPFVPLLNPFLNISFILTILCLLQ